MHSLSMASSFLLPFPVSLIAFMGIIFLIIVIRAKMMLKRESSFNSPWALFSTSTPSGYTPLKRGGIRDYLAGIRQDYMSEDTKADLV